MPHYADGTPAANGDLVIHSEQHDTGSEKVGIVTSITPNAESCNGSVIVMAMRQKGTKHWTSIPHQAQWCVTLRECRKVDELPSPTTSVAAAS